MSARWLYRLLVPNRSLVRIGKVRWTSAETHTMIDLTLREVLIPGIREALSQPNWLYAMAVRRSR